jgi:hypothetical protein
VEEAVDGKRPRYPGLDAGGTSAAFLPNLDDNVKKYEEASIELIERWRRLRCEM